MLRMDVPRRDPTATLALLRLDKQWERYQRLLRAKAMKRHEPCVATVAECIAAKGTKGRRR